MLNIDNIPDLHKIPLKTLLSTKIYNFKGKYYDKLYQEAIELEKKNNENQNSFKFIYNDAEEDKKIVKPMGGGKKNSFDIEIKNDDFKEEFRINSSQFSLKKNIGLKLEKLSFNIFYDTKLGEDIGILGSIKELGEWDQSKIIKLGWTKGNIWTIDIDLKSKDINNFEYKFILLNNGSIKEWENGNNRIFVKKDIETILEENINKNNKYNAKVNNVEYTYYENDKLLRLKCHWNKK